MKKDYLTFLPKMLAAIASTVNRDKIFTVALADIKYLFAADATMTAFVEMNRESAEIKLSAFHDGIGNKPESWWMAEVEDFAEDTYGNSISKQNKVLSTEPLAKKINRNNLLEVAFEVGDREQLGILMVSRTSEEVFSSEDVALFGLIGSQFGVAVTNAKIFEEVLRDGLLCTLEQKNLTDKLLRSQEEERKRIARELHDDTCQSLSNVILRIDMFNARIPSELKQAKAACEELREIVSKALDDVHQMAFDLRPSMLDDLGLVPAIRWYAKEFKEKSQVAINFKLRGKERKLSSEREIVIFRIVQEALTNIRKHAQTNEASLLLDFMDDKVVVEIEDQGRGFAVNETINNSTSRKALGIQGMRERASLLGGDLTINSVPNEKTTIKLEIPISSREGRYYDE